MNEKTLAFSLEHQNKTLGQISCRISNLSNQKPISISHLSSTNAEPPIPHLYLFDKYSQNITIPHLSLSKPVKPIGSLLVPYCCDGCLPQVKTPTKLGISRILRWWAPCQDSDIYLLDDPFSAVDAHTGLELFKSFELPLSE